MVNNKIFISLMILSILIIIGLLINHYNNRDVWKTYVFNDVTVKRFHPQFLSNRMCRLYVSSVTKDGKKYLSVYYKLADNKKDCYKTKEVKNPYMDLSDFTTYMKVDPLTNLNIDGWIETLDTINMAIADYCRTGKFLEPLKLLNFNKDYCEQSYWPMLFVYNDHSKSLYFRVDIQDNIPHSFEVVIPN